MFKKDAAARGYCFPIWHQGNTKPSLCTCIHTVHSQYAYAYAFIRMHTALPCVNL